MVGSMRTGSPARARPIGPGSSGALASCAASWSATAGEMVTVARGSTVRVVAQSMTSMRCWTKWAGLGQGLGHSAGS